MRSSSIAWLRIPTGWLIEFLRGMPVLLMMLFILLVASTGAFWAVVIALILYNGTLIGEVLRAGLVALPRGQREAALSVGMREFQSKMLVEFPQAFRQMLPIIVAQLVVLLKDTSLGYIVGYNEIIRNNMNNLGSFYGNRYIFSLFLVTLVIYLAINLTLSWFARWLSRRTASGGSAVVAAGPGSPIRPPRARSSRSRRRPTCSGRAAALTPARRPRGAGRRHPPSVDSSLVSDSPDNAPSEITPEAVDAAVQAALDAIARRIRYRRPEGGARRAHRARARRSRKLNARLRDVAPERKAEFGKLVGQARGRVNQALAAREEQVARGRDRRAARGRAHRRHGARRRARASGRGIRSRSCRSRSPTSSSAWGGRSPRAPSSSTSGTTSTP